MNSNIHKSYGQLLFGKGEADIPLDSLHTTSLVAILLIGLVAGWLASLIVGGGGLVRDLVTGLVGAVVGAVVLRALGVVLPFRDPLVTDVVTATIGAVIVVVAARAIA